MTQAAVSASLAALQKSLAVALVVGATVVVWAVGSVADHWLCPRRHGLKRLASASSRFGRA